MSYTTLISEDIQQNVEFNINQEYLAAIKENYREYLVVESYFFIFF